MISQQGHVTCGVVVLSVAASSRANLVFEVTSEHELAEQQMSKRMMKSSRVTLPVYLRSEIWFGESPSANPIHPTIAITRAFCGCSWAAAVGPAGLVPPGEPTCFFPCRAELGWRGARARGGAAGWWRHEMNELVGQKIQFEGRNSAPDFCCTRVWLDWVEWSPTHHAQPERGCWFFWISSESNDFGVRH